MTTTHKSASNIKETAQSVLQKKFGSQIELDNGQALGDRPYVHRFGVLNRADQVPSSVIIKEAHLWDDMIYDPNALEGPSVQLFDDWAGLQFLNRVGDHLVPQFYAGDRTTGLIILEDLGESDPLSLLLGSDQASAETMLVGLSRTLGKMHAQTMGQQALFDQIRHQLGKRGGETDIHGYFYNYHWIDQALKPTLTILDLPSSNKLTEELTELISSLTYPGPFLAYTHGDPCPDNCLFRDGQIYLIDFERGLFRHALIDGAFGRVSFPSCWCANAIPQELVKQMEASYRTELIKGCPEAADDEVFNRGLVVACAYWVLTMYQRYDVPTLMEYDDQWGLASLRQRLLTRSRAFAELAETVGYLESLGDIIAKITDHLELAWAADKTTLPIYPALDEA